MLSRVAGKIVRKQIDMGIIQESEEDVYRYGYLLLLETLLNILIGIIIGIVAHALVEVFLFWLFYIPLRIYCGGWHASRTWRCTVVSNLAIVLIILAEHYLMFKWNYLFICPEVVSLVLLVTLSPADTKNKLLDKKEKRKYQAIVILILAVEVIFLFCDRTCNIIFFTHLITSSSVLFQTILNKRVSRLAKGEYDG